MSEKMGMRTIKAVATMAAIAGSLAAQQATVSLVYDTTFPEPFSYVGGIRVLSSGRILLADPMGQALIAIDMDENSADTLGRVGGGPQEYRQPDAVFPLPGDSTLLTDLGNGRLTVITPDGTFGETRPIPQEDASGRLTIVMPRFVDAKGRIYYQPESFNAAGPADSAVVLRFDRSTSNVDTLGVVMLSPTSQSRVGGRVLMSRGPLRFRDDWAACSDGRIAFVHAHDYRVEWVSPNGERLQGPPTEYQRFSIGRAEKEEWIENQGVESIDVLTMMSTSGERTMRFSRGGGGSGRGIDAYDWPDELPPFRPSRAIVSPDGDVWVERYVNAGSAPLIDVFDARGIKTGEFTLRPRRRVVGFGAGFVFLVHADDVGLQWVERYRISDTG